jgi:hypothetical protein
MIFELFIAFVFLALAFIVIGFYTQIKVLALFGFTTIFLLGLTINLSGITYKTGSTENYTYTCTVCGTPATTNNSCTGTPFDCITHDSLGICYLYGGCAWNETANACEGTPSLCSAYIEINSCEMNGCNFTTTTTNGTAGINQTVITSTTTADNYTALNDNASLWVGRWLMIIAVLGFTLVIISNRARE